MKRFNAVTRRKKSKSKRSKSKRSKSKRSKTGSPHNRQHFGVRTNRGKINKSFPVFSVLRVLRNSATPRHRV